MQPPLFARAPCALIGSPSTRPTLQTRLGPRWLQSTCVFACVRQCMCICMRAYANKQTICMCSTMLCPSRSVRGEQQRRAAEASSRGEQQRRAAEASSRGVHVYACASTCMCMCMRVRVHTHMYVSHPYVQGHACMRASVYIHIALVFLCRILRVRRRS